VLTSLPLLRNVVSDLEAARNNGDSSLTLYFTKESHIHTLVNLVLLSGLPIANRRIPELDYAVSTHGKILSNLFLTLVAIDLSHISPSSCMKEITDEEILTKNIPSNSH
jgi:hypothetical protein